MQPNLYQPTHKQKQQTVAWDFIQHLNQAYSLNLENWHDLYQFSINRSQDFWRFFIDYAKTIYTGNQTPVVTNADDFLESVWFKNIRLNFAQNLLVDKSDDEAIVFWAEDKIKQKISRKQLYSQVAKFAYYLKKQGVEKGDRVAVMLPNMIETVVAMLATTSLGAVFSSTSPDFGVSGVIDRFSQINPKIFIGVDGYYYRGKIFDCLDKNTQISQQLNPKKSILVRFADVNAQLDNFDNFDTILKHSTHKLLEFVQVGFNDPVYILFSSGTTGAPKCIVHSVGGTLIQHQKEHLLHVDIKPNDRVFYFTTCGWMMWHWLISSLASRAVLMLYDGAPFLKNNDNILFDYAQDEHFNVMGVSAKYIETVKKRNLAPIKTHTLDTLTTILSTGSVLGGEGFDFVYQNIKKNIYLCSIAGGTDIISCFALGAKMLPIKRSCLQTRGLGMAVEVWDETGNSVIDKKGELVCTQTFPSKPIYFLHDKNHKKYQKAYFDKYQNIWYHGDFVSLRADGQMIFYGRSDTTLNPGGVRIGTAEIYNQVEKIEQILESVVIGKNENNEISVWLFVVLKPELTLNDALILKIKNQIRLGTTPRHVPEKIYQVAGIPRTKSGKISEIAVQKVVHHQKPDNIEALANPQTLDFFKMC